jgi:hypothetical protein
MPCGDGSIRVLLLVHERCPAVVGDRDQPSRWKALQMDVPASDLPLRVGGDDQAIRIGAIAWDVLVGRWVFLQSLPAQLDRPGRLDLFFTLVLFPNLQVEGRHRVSFRGVMNKRLEKSMGVCNPFH